MLRGVIEKLETLDYRLDYRWWRISRWWDGLLVRLGLKEAPKPRRVLTLAEIDDVLKNHWWPSLEKAMNSRSPIWDKLPLASSPHSPDVLKEPAD